VVVVDLWFIESKWRKGTLDYREKAPLAAKDMFLDAKMLFLEKAPNLLSQ
jgi:hypothetical protein